MQKAVKPQLFHHLSSSGAPLLSRPLSRCLLGSQPSQRPPPLSHRLKLFLRLQSGVRFRRHPFAYSRLQPFRKRAVPHTGRTGAAVTCSCSVLPSNLNLCHSALSVPFLVTYSQPSIARVREDCYEKDSGAYSDLVVVQKEKVASSRRALQELVQRVNQVESEATKLAERVSVLEAGGKVVQRQRR